MSTSNIAFPNPTSPLAPVGSRCLCLKFSEKICKQKQRPLTFPDQLSRGIVLSMKEQQTHSFFCRPIQRLATFWTFFLLRHLPPSPYLSVFLSFVEYVFFVVEGLCGSRCICALVISLRIFVCNYTTFCFTVDRFCQRACLSGRNAVGTVEVMIRKMVTFICRQFRPKSHFYIQKLAIAKIYQMNCIFFFMSSVGRI